MSADDRSRAPARRSTWIMANVGGGETVVPGAFPEFSGSRSDVVVGYLRTAITSCQLRPGERINMKDVEERLGVSHIPVREALRALAAEGLIIHAPHRGATVAPVSVADLAHIYDLRRMIEPEVAVRAARRMTASHFDQMAEAAAAVGHAEVDPAALIEADRAFHWSILKHGTTPLITRTLNQLWRSAERYVYIGADKLATAAEREQQHEEIMAAVRRQDETALITTYRHHLTLIEGAVRRRELDSDVDLKP